MLNAERLSCVDVRDDMNGHSIATTANRCYTKFVDSFDNMDILGSTNGVEKSPVPSTGQENACRVS